MFKKNWFFYLPLVVKDNDLTRNMENEDNYF